MHFQRYKYVLDVSLKTRRDSELEGKDIDKAKNVGFKACDQGMVIYEENKLGLSVYYDKRYVLAIRFMNKVLQPSIKDIYITIERLWKSSRKVWLLKERAAASDMKKNVRLLLKENVQLLLRIKKYFEVKTA